MKKILSLILISILILSSFTACGGSGEGTGDDGAQTYKLRLGTHYQTGHPGLEALERAKAKIADMTDGNVQITIYPASQLGDYSLTYEDLMKGSVDLALIPIPSQYDSKLEMNFIPFMVTEYSQLETAFGADSYFHEQYTKVHGDLGVKLLGMYVEGFIGFGLKELPKNYAVADAAKPLLIRCPSIEVYRLATEDMGYKSTTIPYADLYSAMQSGVCDGWIGGTPQLNYTGFRDVIKYYVPYNVFAENVGFLMSQSVFDSMPTEYQTVIEDVFMEEAVTSYTEAEKNDLEALQLMDDYGIEIVELSQDELNAYAAQVQKVTWPKLGSNIGDDVLQKLVEDLNK